MSLPPRGDRGPRDGARSRRALLSLSLAPLLAAACGASEDLDALPKSGESAGQVLYTTWGTPQQREAESWTLLAFEKNYPDLKVNVIASATAAEHVAKQISLLSSGAPPDVIRLPTWSAFTFYNEEVVKRLDAYFKRDGFKTEHLAPPFDTGTFNRRWYGLPRGHGGTWVVFYNRRLLDAAGVKPPAPAWTWDDFLRSAQQLTRPAGGAGGAGGAQWGTALEPIADFYYPWLWGHGGEDIERSFEKSLVDQPAAREALQWLADLRHKHKVAPPAGELPDGPAAFASGRVGLWFGPADAELELARQGGLDFGIATQPKGKVNQVAAFKPDAVCLTAGASYPDDGWELMQFLVDAETQRLELDNGLWLPQSKAITGLETYQKLTAPPYDRRPGIPNALVKARTPVMAPRGDEIRTAHQRELAPFWRGARSVEAATEAATKAANAILTGTA
jgi:multiple sugar transport system substrate-binding protein